MIRICLDSDPNSTLSGSKSKLFYPDLNTTGSGYVRPDHDPAGPRFGSKYGLIRVQLAGRIRIRLDPYPNAAGLYSNLYCDDNLIKVKFLIILNSLLT